MRCHVCRKELVKILVDVVLGRATQCCMLVWQRADERGLLGPFGTRKEQVQ